MDERLVALISVERGSLTWRVFKDRPARARLVGAAVPADEEDAFDLNEAQRVLRRFVRKQDLAGDYGTTL
jgi:hypothetical protein